MVARVAARAAAEAAEATAVPATSQQEVAGGQRPDANISCLLLPSVRSSRQPTVPPEDSKRGFDYQENKDHAKMTYSRIDLLKRDPSFLQLTQKAMQCEQA